MSLSYRDPYKGAPPWGLGFESFRPPREASQSLSWWIRQSYLPFGRNAR